MSITFVGSGDDGSFSNFHIAITSADEGVTWTKQTTQISDSGGPICWADFLSLWVQGTQFASTTEQIQTSPDAVTWTKRSSPANGNQVLALTAGKDKLVAVYGLGVRTIITSADGITWTARSLPAACASITSQCNVCYSADLDLYVIGEAVPVSTGPGGEAGGMLYSSDGITWNFTYKTSNMGGSVGLVWGAGAGLFVCVGGPFGSGEHLYTSPDGITWTRRLGTALDPAGWRAVAYANGVFVAVTDDTSTYPGVQAATSADGLTWTRRTTPGSGKKWSCLASDGTVWIAGSENFPANTTPMMISSDDGVTWSLITLSFNFGVMEGIGSILAAPPPATMGNVWGGGSAQGAGNHW